MGSLIELYPQRVNQVLNNKPILANLQALLSQVPPVPDSYNALVFFLPKLLQNFNGFKLEVSPPLQQEFFSFHYELLDKLDGDDKTAKEDWVMGVCNYSDNPGVESILLNHGVHDFAIQRILENKEPYITRLCVGILRNLFWEGKQEVFEAVVGSEERCALFLQALCVVFD